MSEDKLWTRTFIVLMGINFCSALSFYLTMVKITEFSVDTYGVPVGVAGMGITAYVLGALATRLFFGGKIDTWGVKRALVIGSAVNAGAMALYLVPMDFAILLALRIAHGFGFAIMSGAAAAGAVLVIPSNRYGEGIGYFSMMQALATGVGPFVAILLTNVFGGYTPMFACATVMALIALASTFVLNIPTVQRNNEPAIASKVRPRGIGALIQLSVVPLAAVLFMAYLDYAGILSFITLYASEIGLSDAVSLYFVVYAIVILITRPPVGRRVDRKGENSIIYVCFIALACGFIVLAFTANAVMLLASAALIGFGIGAIQSIVQAAIARDTPPEELGKANSTFFMSMDLGSGIGPIIIGAIIPVIGYSASYVLLAFVGLGAGVLYHFVHGRKQERKRA